MNCDHIKNRLSHFADGSLDEKEHSEIQFHISECLECRNELQKTERLNSLLKNNTPPLPDESYWKTLPSRVMNYIDQQPSALTSWIIRLSRPIPAAAAFMISAAIFMSVFLLSTTNNNHTLPREISYTEEMTFKAIDLSNTTSIEKKAEKIVEVMNIHVQRLHDMALMKRPGFVEQYALSYSRIVESGFSRIINEAQAQGVDTQNIRDIFRKTGNAHVIELRKVIENIPEKKESLEKAIQSVKIL